MEPVLVLLSVLSNLQPSRYFVGAGTSVTRVLLKDLNPERTSKSRTSAAHILKNRLPALLTSFFKGHGTCAPVATSGLSIVIISIMCFFVKPRTIVHAPAHTWTQLNQARATCRPVAPACVQHPEKPWLAQKPCRAEHLHRFPLGPLTSQRLS